MSTNHSLQKKKKKNWILVSNNKRLFFSFWVHFDEMGKNWIIWKSNPNVLFSQHMTCNTKSLNFWNDFLTLSTSFSDNFVLMMDDGRLLRCWRCRWRRWRRSSTVLTAVTTSTTAAALAVVRFVTGDDEIAFQFQRLNNWTDDGGRCLRCCLLVLLLLLLLLLLVLLLSGVMIGRQFSCSRRCSHCRRVVMMSQCFGKWHVKCCWWFTIAVRSVRSVVTAVKSRRDAKRRHGGCERVR